MLFATSCLFAVCPIEGYVNSNRKFPTIPQALGVWLTSVYWYGVLYSMYKGFLSMYTDQENAVQWALSLDTFTLRYTVDI